MEDKIVELAQLSYLKDFVDPVMFPFRTGRDGDDRKILDVSGESGELFSLLERQFPGALVERLDIAGVMNNSDKEKYDYIAAGTLHYPGCGTDEVLKALLRALKPGGIVSAGVYGYSGYHALLMLSALVGKVTGGKKDAAGVTTARAVLNRLAPSHPVFRHTDREFLERLKGGDGAAFDLLLNLSPDQVLTVSRLVGKIEQVGGGGVEWLYPRLYEPATYFSDREILDRLQGLPGPRRWAAVELLAASPPDHRFFFYRGDRPPKRVAWEPDDLYQCRPVQLPLYKWSEFSAPRDDSCILEPGMDCRSVPGVELRQWQAQLCLSADGSESLQTLLFKNGLEQKPVREIVSFLKEAAEARVLALLPPG